MKMALHRAQHCRPICSSRQLSARICPHSSRKSSMVTHGLLAVIMLGPLRAHALAHRVTNRIRCH